MTRLYVEHNTVTDPIDRHHTTQENETMPVLNGVETPDTVVSAYRHMVRTQVAAETAYNTLHAAQRQLPLSIAIQNTADTRHAANEAVHAYIAALGAARVAAEESRKAHAAR